jgi:hypothetical protein
MTTTDVHMKKSGRFVLQSEGDFPRLRLGLMDCLSARTLTNLSLQFDGSGPMIRPSLMMFIPLSSGILYLDHAYQKRPDVCMIFVCLYYNLNVSAKPQPLPRHLRFESNGPGWNSLEHCGDRGDLARVCGVL